MSCASGTTVAAAASTGSVSTKHTNVSSEVFREVVAKLTSQFSDLPASQVGAAIDQALGLLGVAVVADRTSLFLACAEGERFERVSEWRASHGAVTARDATREAAARIRSEPSTPGEVIRLSELPWLAKKLSKFETVHLPRISDLPEQARTERATFSGAGVCSSMVVPMVAHGTLAGFLEIDCFASERSWGDDARLLARISVDLMLGLFERKRAEDARDESQDRLQRTQRLEVVGRLAGGIAHDFNNFLTAIIGYGELLELGLEEGDPSRDEVHEIRRAADRASALVEQILSFERNQSCTARVVDLNWVVVDLEKILRRVVHEDVDLTCDLGQGIGSALVDPARIDQVLVNLAVNACDAMPEGGSLTVSTHAARIDGSRRVSWIGCSPPAGLPQGDYVVLSVRDTGCGMDSTTRERLFEPFFTTKQPGRGTGLGLATVSTIVSDCGGGISVESEVGRGSVFHLFFPAVEDTTALDLPVAADSPIAEISGGRETVLLVEADRAVRSLLRRVLEGYGYKVLEAEDGDAAGQVCGRHRRPIHLLVTDIAIPRMTGREVADQLCQLRPGLRVLYTSSYPEAMLRDDGTSLPDNTLLEKPFTPRALALAVRRVLDARRPS